MVRKEREVEQLPAAAVGQDRATLPPAPFQLRLFDQFALAGPGGPIHFGNKKLCGLVAILAESGAPQSRDSLMSLLWGSHFETQARQNLRQAVLRVRAVLGDDALISDANMVSLRPGMIASDVEKFRALLAEGSLTSLATAVTLYRDRLLADVRIKEDGWSAWVAARQDQLQTAVLSALLRLGNSALDHTDDRAALSYAERATTIDPLREDAQRLLMQALAASGRTAEALRKYEQFAALLKRELDAKPDTRTSALAARVRTSATAVTMQGDVQKAIEPSGANHPADRPAIAVLPFTNMSGAADQDHYADGIVEDIITSLSRMRWLMVIARNSSFTFKGKAVDIKQVGRELGARYVVEGSVRIDSNRVRITAQLIEAETGAHIWAERYDGALGDIFALQDEISDSIVAAIEPSIRTSELARVRNKPTDSLDAYDLYLRALSHMYALDRNSYRRAQELLRRAIEIDPHYSEALSALADSIARQWLNGWIAIGEIDERRREALALSRRAGAADPTNGTALAVGAYAFTVMNGHFEEGAELAERAARMQPSSAYVRNLCGQVHVHNGESDQAIAHFERARRLDPLDPRGYITLNGIAMAHFFAGRFGEAEQWGRRALTESAEWNVTRRFHAASLAHLGRIDDARAEVQELLLVQPNSSLARSRTSNFRHPRMYELYIKGLRLAGLPESQA